MFLALKEIKKEKARFLLIISIFVLISYLVYFLLGLAYGLAVDNKTAVDQWNAKQIILASGSNNNISSSMIDQEELESNLSDIDYSLINLSRSAAYKNSSETEKNTIDIALIGLNPDSDIFPEIVEGEKISNDKDVIASSSLRDEEGLEIGDELKLAMNGSVFTIVGFTNDYKFNTSPVIYTKLKESSTASIIYKPMQEDAQQQANEEISSEEQTSEENSQETTEEASKEQNSQETIEETSNEQNSQVDASEESSTSSKNQNESSESSQSETSQSETSQTTEQEVDQTSSATTSIPDRVSAAIISNEENIEIDGDYDIVSIEKFINKIPGYYAQLLTFGLMIGFLILIAAIVLGVFLYIITIQKKQTFAIMKIQGISNSFISKSVIIQTFIVSVVGLAIGLLLTYVTYYFLPNSVPFTPNIVYYLIITVLMIITAQIGAIFSVRSVAKVDPLEVL